ncbi:hypothetical protein WJX81_004574 [Elliptochloris bilobata]|uniref:VTT domain-containing protein n=1 Tax=Elliptochloris bilobata TaxID=381761 RepID=A0AAW1SKS1_9CHLO
MFGGARSAELASDSSALLLPDGKTTSSELPELPVYGRGALDVITQPPEALAATSEPEHLPPPLWQKVLRFCLHNWEKVVVLCILLVLIILVSVKGVTVFKDIIHWFEKQNNWIGWTCFTLLYCLNISILLPGILFILAAGFVFGFWKGLLAVWLGGGVGQSLAFLLARYLVGGWVSALARGKSKKWDVIDKAMELEGWKLLLLVRLSPLVPYNLLNIAMAATKIHFWAFALVSFFGIIPECALFTYTGSLAENIGAIVSGEAKPRAVVTYVMAGITVLLLLATATLATILIRRALKRADLHLREDPETGCPEVDAGSQDGRSGNLSRRASRAAPA